MEDQSDEAGSSEVRAGQGSGIEREEAAEATWERKSSQSVLVARAKLRPVPFNKERLRNLGSEPKKGCREARCILLSIPVQSRTRSSIGVQWSAR